MEERYDALLARYARWQAAYPQLSGRCRHQLSRAGLEPSDLPHQRDSQLLAVRQFGVGCLAEVRALWPEPPAPPEPEYVVCSYCAGAGRIEVSPDDPLIAPENP